MTGPDRLYEQAKTLITRPGRSRTDQAVSKLVRPSQERIEHVVKRPGLNLFLNDWFPSESKA